MAIRFRSILRGEPGVIGGGVKKYYASANVTEVVDLEQLSELVSEATTVHGADIRAVLYALVKVICRELSNSKSVQLGELGNLRTEVSSHGTEDPEEVNSSLIKRARVIFTPGKLIKKMLKTVEYKKID